MAVNKLHLVRQCSPKRGFVNIGINVNVKVCVKVQSLNQPCQMFGVAVR